MLSMGAGFKYSALASEKKKIRLLELQPGRYGRELHGKLRIVELQDQPKYEALSYTWGPITEDRCLILDVDSALPLSDNLYRALQHLRHRFPKASPLDRSGLHRSSGFGRAQCPGCVHGRDIWQRRGMCNLAWRR